MGKHLIFVLLALAAGAAAAAGDAPPLAQDIYRCGDSYSQRPCPGGTLVPTDDARSASQRAQTSQAARRDAQLAATMEKARLKEEAKPVQVYVPPPKTVATQGDGAKADGKPKKPAQFTVTGAKKPAASKVKAAKKAAKTPGKKKTAA